MMPNIGLPKPLRPSLTKSCTTRFVPTIRNLRGELTALMGALDAMGWKTNSQAWLAKYYEKVLSMVETLSRLLEEQGDQFRVEGLQEAD